MRLVLDTNTLVSGFLWGGNPARLIDAASAGQVVIITSLSLLAELEEVLSRPKFRKAFAKANLTPSEVVEMYRELALIVDPVELTESVVRDPDDDKLVACALGGKADYIVSGDFDLLELRAYQNISIVTVAACLDFID